jgi:hypothetical protein
MNLCDKLEYYSVREESILHYFTRCGILGSVDPAAVIDNLLSEGLHVNPLDQDRHIPQLEAYESWWHRSLNELLSSFDRFCSSTPR